MDAIGKTVARIEEDPTGEYGHIEHDTVIVHFTDGTALAIEGSSYEAVSQSVSMLGREEVNALARAATGRREVERLRRLQRDEWLSISCEERGERKRAREARMGPIANAFAREMDGALRDAILDNSRMVYGARPERSVVLRCENCGETQCPNAQVKVYPAEPAPEPYVSNGFSIKVEPGSLGPDRS